MSVRRLAAFLMTLLSLQAVATIKDYPFRLDTRKTGQDYLLVAVNNGPATISFVATIKGENIRTDRSWPALAVVKPHSSQQIARISAATPGSAYRFSTHATHNYGDATMAPDSTVAYRLPFAEGLRFPVGQAFGGEITTHTEPNSLHAVDFTMPEGTPIVAARPGTVVEVVDGFTAGGKESSLLDKANSVSILHADGTIAQYVHLAPGGIAVQEGQTVQGGQKIALSGNTGYSSGPHLHFVVTRTIINAASVVAFQSIPITFQAFNPPVRFSATQDLIAAAEYSRLGSPEYRKDPAPALAQASAALQRTGQIPSPAETAAIEIVREAAGNLDHWATRILDHTGYPWWAWLVAFFAALIVVRILIELNATRFMERREPTLDWRDHTSDPEAFGRRDKH